MRLINHASSYRVTAKTTLRWISLTGSPKWQTSKMNVHTTDCVCRGRLCHPGQTSAWTRDQIRTHAPYYNGTPERFCLGLYLYNLSRRGQNRPPVRKGDLTPRYFHLTVKPTRQANCVGCLQNTLDHTFSQEKAGYTRARICTTAEGEIIHHRDNDRRLTSLAYSTEANTSRFSINSRTAKSIEGVRPIMCISCDDRLAYTLKRKIITEDETMKHITITSASANAVAFGFVVATGTMSQNVYKELCAIGVKLERLAQYFSGKKSGRGNRRVTSFESSIQDRQKPSMNSQGPLGLDESIFCNKRWFEINNG